MSRADEIRKKYASVEEMKKVAIEMVKFRLDLADEYLDGITFSNMPATQTDNSGKVSVGFFVGIINDKISRGMHIQGEELVEYLWNSKEWELKETKDFDEYKELQKRFGVLDCDPKFNL